MELIVRRADDFDVTGDGAAPAWATTAWQTLQPTRPNPAAYATQAKMLYSMTGIYVLVDCADRTLTCTDLRDHDDLWTEDVVEVFLQPDADLPLYVEYELSPLGKELPLLVSNTDGTFFGWSPWHYEGDRLVRKATAVRGGPKAPGARVEGWTAEMFIPWTLFRGLPNIPPASGMRWRGNLYRIDHDGGSATQWAWATPIQAFHDYERFGTFRFA
ncbi:MAG: carbohydrate-binding family 9-like protein [Planctomycetota bacterium]